jgi:hypothetical protein
VIKERFGRPGIWAVLLQVKPSRTNQFPFVSKNSKDFPAHIEIKRFRETKTTAYRNKKAAWFLPKNSIEFSIIEGGVRPKSDFNSLLQEKNSL